MSDDYVSTLKSLLPSFINVPMSQIGDKLKSLKISDYLQSDTTELIDWCQEKFAKVQAGFVTKADPSIDDIIADMKKFTESATQLSGVITEMGQVESLNDAVEKGYLSASILDLSAEKPTLTMLLDGIFSKTVAPISKGGQDD